jgi:23S rRNA (adenine2503-C2)-methyltransferase
VKSTQADTDKMGETPQINLMNLGSPALTDYFDGIGENGFRSTQIIKWVHQHGVIDYSSMTNLSKNLREKLQNNTELRPPTIDDEQISEDGTRKWLVRTDPFNCVETVFIPEGDRGTLCVSSQVGCPLNCQFCATATQGFSRNLSVGEIIGQVWLAARKLGQSSASTRKITNVVMMGMGEPLLNFDNAVASMKLMMDDNAYGLSKRRVTLSTAGVIPGIKRLADECPVSLAISLHATNDELRNKLVPINRKYPIAELIQACKEYSRATNDGTITFEYVMLKDINDSVSEARRLAQLLGGIPAKVNLIPFNTFKGNHFARSSESDIDAFRERLSASGIITITRKTRGSDIDAACGQLVGDVTSKKGSLASSKRVD